MSKWRNSIITYIDLIDIKNIEIEGNIRATDIMRKMHTLVSENMTNGMLNHDHCYIWNDSILLLAYLDQGTDENSIIKEADQLKRKIDKICSSYAISVKGQTFPDDLISQTTIINEQASSKHRVIKLKTSSYAMGNCYRIEERLGKRLKKPWYIDSRIGKKLNTNCKFSKHQVKMLPNDKERDIYIYDAYLW